MGRGRKGRRRKRRKKELRGRKDKQRRKVSIVQEGGRERPKYCQKGAVRRKRQRDTDRGKGRKCEAEVARH